MPQPIKKSSTFERWASGYRLGILHRPGLSSAYLIPSCHEGLQSTVVSQSIPSVCTISSRDQSACHQSCRCFFLRTNKATNLGGEIYGCFSYTVYYQDKYEKINVTRQFNTKVLQPNPTYCNISLASNNDHVCRQVGATSPWEIEKKLC